MSTTRTNTTAAAGTPSRSRPTSTSYTDVPQSAAAQGDIPVLSPSEVSPVSLEEEMLKRLKAADNDYRHADAALKEFIQNNRLGIFQHGNCYSVIGTHREGFQLLYTERMTAHARLMEAMSAWADSKDSK